jgi:hypothetical protein
MTRGLSTATPQGAQTVGKDDALSNGQAIIEVLYLEALATKLGQLEVEKQKYLQGNSNAPQAQDDWLIKQETDITELREKITETISHIKAITHEKKDQRQSWWSRIRMKDQTDF